MPNGAEAVLSATAKFIAVKAYLKKQGKSQTASLYTQGTGKR